MPTRVSTDNGGSSSGDTSIVTTGTSHTAGNSLIALIAWGGSATISSISNTASDTFNLCTGTNGATPAGTNYAIYVAHSINGNASDVTTVSLSGSASYRSLIVVEYSGLDTTSTCETAAKGSGGTTVTTASFSPAASGNLNIALGVPENSGNWTAGSGYTIVIEDSIDRAVQEQLSAASGAQTASMDFTSGSPQNGLTLASLKPSGGGGPVAAEPPKPTLLFMNVG